MRPLSPSSEAPATAGAFLLPWQLLSMGWLCGIWATRFPQPALCIGLLLALAVWHRHPVPGAGRRIRLFPCLLLCSVLAGNFAALRLETHEDSSIPLFIQNRVPVRISGTVVDVEAVPDGRLHVILDDVRCRGFAESPPAIKPDAKESSTTTVLDQTAGTADPDGSDGRTMPDTKQTVPLHISRPERGSRSASAATNNSGDMTGSIPLLGRVIWTWDHPEPVPGIRDGYRIGPGQHITLTQRVKPVRGFLNPGTWDSGQYWRDKGVLWRVWSRGTRFDLAVSGTPDRLWQLREHVRSSLMHLLENTPPLLPEAGNAAATIPALLFGDRYSLTYDRMDQLSLASLSHSLALSGMHLGVVSGIGWGLAWLLGWFAPGIYLRMPRPKLATLLAAPLVAGYVWLGGASPSLFRAALMFACWGILLWRNRPRVLLDGVFMAVTLITLHAPLALFDLRLQLSALAVLSLALFLPWIEHHVHRLSPQESPSERKKRPFRHRVYSSLRTGATGLLAANICIQLGMLPVIIWNFNSSSLWFPLNLLWLPVLGLWILPACFAGLALCLAAGALPAGAVLMMSPVTGLLTELARGCFTAATIPVSALFAGLDWLHLHGWLQPNLGLRPHWLEMAGYWCILAASALIFSERAGQSNQVSLSVQPGNRTTGTLVMALGACLLCLPLTGRMLHAADDTVTLTMLDVGQGQSLLITLPQGHRILIDGGGFGITGFDTGKSIVTPALTWQKPPRLDMIVNTHQDTDHLQGLFHPLRYLSVPRYTDNGKTGSKDNEARLQQILDQTGIRRERACAGDILYEQGNISLEVLHPATDLGHTSSNNAALALRLVQTRNGSRHGLALILGDLEKQGIRALLKSGNDLGADVLVLPHHGSSSSFEPALYETAAPRIALSATGFLNQWGFPSEDVRDALAERHIPLYDTALNGQIQVTWPTESSSDRANSETPLQVSVMRE